MQFLLSDLIIMFCVISLLGFGILLLSICQSNCFFACVVVGLSTAFLFRYVNNLEPIQSVKAYFFFLIVPTYGQVSLLFQSLESYPANRSVKRSFDDRTRKECGFSASETEGPMRDLRRLKMLDYEPEDVGVKNSGHIQSTVLQSESLVVSNSELELKSGAPLADETLPAISDDSHANNYICGFCQSFKISEVNFH